MKREREGREGERKKEREKERERERKREKEIKKNLSKNSLSFMSLNNIRGAKTFV